MGSRMLLSISVLLLAIVLALLFSRRRRAIAAPNITTATSSDSDSPNALRAEWREQAQQPIFSPIAQRTVGGVPVVLQTGLLVNHQRQVFRFDVIGADSDRGREFVQQYVGTVKVFLQQRWAPVPSPSEASKESPAQRELERGAPPLNLNQNSLTIIFDLLGISPHSADQLKAALADINASKLTTKELIGQLRERVQLESVVGKNGAISQAAAIDFYVDPHVPPRHEYKGWWASGCDTFVIIRDGDNAVVSLTRNGYYRENPLGRGQLSTLADPNQPNSVYTYTLSVDLAQNSNYSKYEVWGTWYHQGGWTESLQDLSL